MKVNRVGRVIITSKDVVIEGFDLTIEAVDRGMGRWGRVLIVAIILEWAAARLVDEVKALRPQRRDPALMAKWN